MDLREAYQLVKDYRKVARDGEINLDRTIVLDDDKEKFESALAKFIRFLPKVNSYKCHWCYQRQPIHLGEKNIRVPQLISFDYDGCVRLKVRDEPQYTIKNKERLEIKHLNNSIEEEIREFGKGRKLVLGIELMISLYGLVLNKPHAGREWYHFNKFTKEGATLGDLVDRTIKIAPLKDK